MTKGSGSRIALLFVFCAPFFVGGIQTQTLKASALPPIIAQSSQDQKAPEVRTFTGKVLFCMPGPLRWVGEITRTM